MARKRTKIENQIRRINDAIRRVFNRYGRFTIQQSNITKLIKETFADIPVKDAYKVDTSGLIQITNKAAVRQAVDDTSILNNIEAAKPTLTAMKRAYTSRKNAEIAYFMNNKFESIYEILDSPYLTVDQKDILGAIIRSDRDGGRIGEINREHTQDDFIEVVTRAMGDPTLDIAETLEKMGILDYEETPESGTGYTYSDNISMKP